MQTVKEKAANVAASAKSGMEKAKASVQEKVDRMTAHNPMEKEMASEKKEERINQAELNKREAYESNAAAKITGAPHTYSTSGAPGHYPTGTQVVEGVAESHPVGTAPRNARFNGAHNTPAGTAGTGGA